MLDSLKKIGFKYDSSVSVNSFFNKTDSPLKNILSHPYHPMINNIEPGKNKDFIEFPFAYYQVGGVKIPTSGGPMLRFLGAPLILKGLKQSLNRGHTVFYWHPIDISYDKFPKVGKGRPMYWVIKGKIVEDRIKFILKNLNNSEVEFKTLSDMNVNVNSKILLNFNNNQLKTDSVDVVL